MAKSRETLEEFYKHKLDHLYTNNQKEAGQFNVFRIEDRLRTGETSPTYIRRDFFKIMLFQGNNVFHYGDKSIPVTGNTLLFFNPRVPYTYDPLAPGTKGFFCVFRDEFFKENQRLNLQSLPLFTAGAQPVFTLNKEQTHTVQTAFEKMIHEIEASYIYKFELIKSYVTELIFLAMKFQPSENFHHQSNAAWRITSVFSELLERQFPIESPSQRFELRSPKTFADRLSVHVNYLNRAIKKTTGRTTTDLISERLTSEAKALLKYTSWSIADIAFSLGFETQAQFNNFFRKHAGINPSAYRQV